MGSKLGGRSLGMQMKAMVFRLLSILIREQTPKPMCHLQSLALTSHLRNMRCGICTPSFEMSPLRYPTQHALIHFHKQRFVHHLM